MVSMRFIPDPFTLALLFVLVLGAVLPASGGFADGLGTVADIAIGLVFFLHGARLQRQVVIAGIRHWRLHAFILATTFLVFPVAGLLLTGVLPSSIAPALVTGLVFMCLLPSTVQSSIAFTSVAGGNVVAAVCAATASNLLGMFLTPFAVGLILHTSGTGLSLNTLGPILFQLLLPFIAGQVLQPWVGDFVRKQKKLLSFVDRGAILLVVYLAFSGAVVAGLWGQLSIGSLAILILACFILLAAILAFTTFGSRLLGFSREDEIAIVFCGSMKSLVSGIPIANVLFAGPDLGFILLPVMLFHQIQLISSALIARRYAAQRVPAKT
ncbi:MAG: bile acid:sodium symporter [Bauldia sp.]|nr:bile acid:sodium symporter [Bauldia sp.]